MSLVQSTKCKVASIGFHEKRYNRILIDSPPSTAATDAVALSQSVDGIILILRAGATTKEMAKNGVAQFEAVGAPILGVVLNGVGLGRDSYYYYQYSHSYYDDSEDEKKKRSKKKPKDPYGTQEATSQSLEA